MGSPQPRPSKLCCHSRCNAASATSLPSCSPMAVRCFLCVVIPVVYCRCRMWDLGDPALVGDTPEPPTCRELRKGLGERAHSGPLVALVSTHDGQLVWSATAKGILLWDAASGAFLGVLQRWVPAAAAAESLAAGSGGGSGGGGGTSAASADAAAAAMNTYRIDGFKVGKRSGRGKAA